MTEVDAVGEALVAINTLITMVGEGDFYQDYDESTSAYGKAREGWEVVVDAILSSRTEITDLRAKVMEYEHVLEHVRDPHPVPGAPPQTACSECQRMAQTALDGTYRSDWIEMVTDG